MSACFNPLMGTGNYSTVPHHMKLVLSVDGWAVHLVLQGVDWEGPQPAQAPPRCTTYQRPVYTLLYSGPLLCGFNVPVKALRLRFTS